ncbi:hypothetical protein QNK01_10970 [Desemzia incerta]|uniref:hypothetical protein n=1 Tax=Desemzia incerta TaxID=82801 RepID=UPI0024C434D4|nr:hypothetical protein [Desemzia incerta]WHZ31955.1 hypothetical protein QNK01_10970 [Desemzia incerta]
MVTDWMISIFTLSDYIFAMVGASLVISGNYHVKRNQLLWVLLLLGVIVANIVMNINLNENFVLKTGVAALIRITYYAVIVTGVYNYVKSHQLEAQFLEILNIVAVIVVAIGIYITIALYSEGQLPYEILWTFTRTDEASYFFKENASLIRTRSVFSEPSYLGYYLNVILSINLFNKVQLNTKRVYNFLIVTTVLLTFSYSAIGTMIFIFILYIFSQIRTGKIKWTRMSIIYLLIIFVLIFIFWDFLDETIMKRSVYILSGEDVSAYNRLVSSWKYVNLEHIFVGNGIGHTPNIWNVYAYILSDIGLAAFLLSGIFSLFFLYKNFYLGSVFIILNFQKGGYLNPIFSLLLLLMFIYMSDYKK